LKNQLLVYTQDLGGVRCLLPILETLESDFPAADISFLRHESSRSVFDAVGFLPSKCREVEGGREINVEEWRETLKRDNITHVLCTLSSPRIDPTNVNLVLAARDLKIPTLGIMDHWKGYDRFYDQEGEPKYFTDLIGCIDSFSFHQFLKCGISKEKLHIVGHPGLERLVSLGHVPVQSKRGLCILIVSQPDSSDGTFRGIFFKDLAGTRIIDRLSSLQNFSECQRIAYRYHPKEKQSASLPVAMKTDESSSIEEAFSKYNLFIGLDSMMLFEASLVGRKCLILDLPELLGNRCATIPYRYGHRIKQIDEIEMAVRDEKDLFRGTGENLWQIRLHLQGSRERCRQLIQRHLDSEV